HPLDQPPTSDPQPIVPSDTGTDAAENSGACLHWINCLAPFLAGLANGEREMGEPSTPPRRPHAKANLALFSSRYLKTSWRGSVRGAPTGRRQWARRSGESSFSGPGPGGSGRPLRRFAGTGATGLPDSARVIVSALLARPHANHDLVGTAVSE